MPGETFFSLPATMVRLLLLFSTLTIVVYLELKTGRIYNYITLTALLLGLLVNILIGAAGKEAQTPIYGSIEGAQWSLMGGLVGFAIYFFFYLVGYMLNYKFIGGGDVKLMAAIGTIAGTRFTLHVIYWTILIAAVMGIYTLVKNKVFLRGLVRSLRIFFLMPPDREDEQPVAEGGVSYGLAIALGAGIAFFSLQGFR